MVVLPSTHIYLTIFFMSISTIRTLFRLFCVQNMYNLYFFTTS